jgi:hypothetical protein
MARNQVVSYTITCDVCGEEIPDNESDDATREFSLDGASYQVDICARHREELSEILDRLKAFVDAGSRQAQRGRRRARAAKSRTPRARKATAATAKATSSAPASEVAAIRAWAVENGHAVGDRGRIPSKISAAYYEAKGAPPAAAPARKRQPRKAAASAE